MSDINEKAQNNIEKKKPVLNYKNIALSIFFLLLIISLPFTFFKNKPKERDEVTETRVQPSQSSLNQILQPAQEKRTTADVPDFEIPEENEAYVAPDNSLAEWELKMQEEALKRQMMLEQMRYEAEMNRRKGALLLRRYSSTNEMEKQAQPQFPPFPPFPGMQVQDPNLRNEKNSFRKNSSEDSFIIQNSLVQAKGMYEVKAGTIIPMTLVTGINSDLPGVIVAVVKDDVYDSKTGKKLIIPGGSKVLGKYSSDVSFGQERVQIVWNRITLPNQKSIDIGSMFGVDKMGYSGATDKVNHHMGKVVKSVLISGALGAATASVSGNSDSTESAAGEAAALQAMSVASNYSNKVLNVQPTITIRPGYTVGLMVDKDLILEVYKK